VHQIRLEGLGRYYLPLPKLNSVQVQFLSQHLRDRGFTVHVGKRILLAVAGTSRITVNPAGLSSSSGELLDAISPAIPSLLSFDKERVTNDLVDQQPLYFSPKKSKAGTLEIQLFTRMEGFRTWTELRKTGLCGLTPDEEAVIASLLQTGDGSVECVTDFLSETSFPLRLGRVQYFLSRIPVDEFVSTLRTVSKSSRRNSYLPRDSTLRVRVEKKFDLGADPGGLGEWCYLLGLPKTSNSGG
jgi:hypothetical protein